MGNPADRLAAIVERWNRPNAGATIEEDRRAIALEAGSDLWRYQAHAMTLLTKCLEEIEALRRSGVQVGHYEDAIESWTRAITFPGTAWNANGSGKARCIADSDLNLLRGLASQIDQQRGFASPYVIRHEAVEGFLEEVESLVGRADFPEGARVFVLSLIRGIREALDADDPQRVLEYFSMLLGAITMATETHEDAPWRSRAREFRRDLSVALASDGIVGAGGLLARGIASFAENAGDISV